MVGDEIVNSRPQFAAVIQKLSDRADISDLINLYGQIGDERNFERFPECFTTDVIGEYPHGRAEGIDAMVELAKGSLGLFVRTQHVISNLVIEFANDQARGRSNLIATHVYAGDSHFDAGGRYDYNFVRTPVGWRIARVALMVIWTAGRNVLPVGK